MSDMPPPPPDDSDWSSPPLPPDPDWSSRPPPPPDDAGWSSQPPVPPPLVGPPTAGGVPGARPALLGTGDAVALASPGTRFTARIVDLLVLAVLGSVLGFVAGPAGTVIVAAAYETIFIATKGQTPGKMATRIRIVRTDDGAIPGWGASAARWALPSVASIATVVASAVAVESAAIDWLGVIGLLVYVSLLWDRRRQGWHDKVARTLVINTPAQTALSNRVAIWLGVAFVALIALLVGLVIWAFASFGF